MAELDAQLRLDIDQALRDINQIEGALDRALGSVELRLDSTSARRQLDDLAQQADQALDDVDIDFDAGAASRLNSELAGVERNLEGADREADQLAGSLRGAARAANDTNASAGGLARSFSGIGSALAGIGVAAGAFVAIRGAIGFAIDAKDAFATLQDSANAVKVVFGDAVGTINEFGESVAQSAGLSTAEFNQAASVLGSALLNVGFSADIAATKTVELTQRAADMASIFGGPVGDALGAIQSALRGETDPIERFGVSLSEAAVNAQAAALGFQTVAGEFSTSEKAAARLDLIMQQTARTSGDFANTSGDLANAQKVLAAEFENAKASIGEALLPIFQTLLDIAPEVIGSIEQLVPSIQGFAVSLAGLLEHREGALDLLDILQGFADLPRFFGEVGTAVSGLVDGVATVNNILGNPLVASETWADGMERAAQRGQESIERINTQGLVNDLRAGADAASALATRLVRVGREGKLDPKFIRDLTTVAGTDLRETAASLQTILNLGKTSGLTGVELRAIAVALAQLKSAGESSEADRFFARTADAADDLTEAGGPAVETLQDIQTAASEAGLGFIDLLTGVDPIAQKFRDLLTPSQDLDLVFDALEEDVTIAAGLFRDSLRPSIIDASEALQNFGTDGKLSLDEFITGLRETETAARNFRANLITILATEGGAELFEELRNAPADVAAAIAEEAVTTGRIAETAAALLGDPELLAAEFLRIQRDALRILRTQGPEAAALFVEGSIALFEDEKQIQDDLRAQLDAAVEASKTDVGNWIERVFSQDDALNRAAGFTADHYSQQVIERFGQSTFVSGSDIGDIVEAGFTQDDAANTAAGLTADAYEQGVINRIGVGGFLSGVDLGDTIAAAFASDDELNKAFFAGLQVNDAFWDGATTVSPKSVRNVTTSVSKTLSSGLKESSPSKIFMDAGLRSADAYWLGFEQADLSLRVPVPQMTGKISTGTAAAAAGGDAGFTFAPTYVNTETKDLETVVARSEQLMGAVSGILNGRFKL